MLFRSLVTAGGGLVLVADGMDAHLVQLDAALAAPAEVKPFVRAFVRPNGLDVAATPVFVDAVEVMRDLRPPVPAPDGWRSVWLALARSAARLRDRERWERWTLSSREYASAQHLRDARQVKARRRADARREAERHTRVDQDPAHDTGQIGRAHV